MITFTSGAYSIELPDPELGDGETWDLRTQLRLSMDGTINTFISTPSLKKQIMNFTLRTRNKAWELVQFLKNTMGSQTTLVDHNNVTWTGYIITDPTELTVESRGLGVVAPKEFTNVELVFEGTHA
jgi:hypothetical protein